MARSLSRRNLLKHSAAAGVGYWIAGRCAWADGVPDVVSSPNERLNVGFIGTAHQAEYDRSETVGSGLVNCVALCDVDAKLLGKAAADFPKAKTYGDFRKLLEQKDIDAVVIATPDHIHAPATAAALRLGKHVYCEKPLTHTVHEARVVMDLTAQYKRCTQMGTQIHAGSNYRRVVELVQSGAIGKIGEVHVWCGKNWSADKFPTEAQPVPGNLNYDLWVGPAPFHEYNSAFLPSAWRRYWAYGDGTLGDMACHFMDLPFWALDLGHATKISADGPELIPECAPLALTVHWEFPARGELPPVKLSWYDGGNRPPQFTEWNLKPQWTDGILFIGEKGMLFSDYDQHHLLPEKDFKDFVRPPKTIPDSVGHHKEWVMACLKNDWTATTCRFRYSGVLTEAVLLGNVAYRSGKTIEWDAANQKILNAPEAESLLHYQYRKGWTL